MQRLPVAYAYRPDIDDELTRWFSSSTIFLGEDDDVFSWWAKNCNHFRRISLAAKDFLATPSGSVPSERAFSAAGRLVTSFCTSLSHDSIQAHVCLSSWFQEDGIAFKEVGEEMDVSDVSYDVVDHDDD